MADTQQLEATRSETAAVEDEYPHGDGVVHEHPSNAVYIRIAVILGVITAVEIGLYYLERLGINPIALGSSLIILSALKFGLVAAFFMHLKFDNRIFTTFFVGGMLMTAAALIAVLAMFRAF
jgi:cytochrome c oxidase subunit IV